MRRMMRRRSTSSLVSPRAEPGADAAALLRQLGGGAAAQPGQAVAQQGQLDLRLALEGVGVLGEDVEDHRGAVDRRAPEQLLQVVLLRRRELVVEHDRVGVDGQAQLAAAPRPCPCRCTRCGRARRGAARRGRPRRRRRCRPAAASSSRLASVSSSVVPGSVTPTSTIRSRIGALDQRGAECFVVRRRHALLLHLRRRRSTVTVATNVAGPIRVTVPGRRVVADVPWHRRRPCAR